MKGSDGHLVDLDVLDHETELAGQLLHGTAAGMIDVEVGPLAVALLL